MSLYLGTTPIANDGSHNTANVDLSNLSNTGEAHFANPALTNSPYTTNRILEIPQNLQISVNGDTITISGKATRLNGDLVNINVSRTFTGTVGKTYVLISAQPYSSMNTWTFSENNNIVSYRQDSQPTITTAYAFWFDTANNRLMFTSNTGSSWYEIVLPFGVAHYTSNGWVIDQIFNGFGYIGSTVFALPGVKVQVPNGKNEDGTYINYIEEITSVKTNTFTSESGSVDLYYDSDTQSIGAAYTGTYTYDSSTNSYVNKVTGLNVTTLINVANCICTSGKISSFKFANVDSVANSNASNFSQAGRSYLSGLGMPSGRYIDLTLGASNSTYTAPANGTVLAVKRAVDVGQNLGLARVSSGIFFDFAWNSVANSNIFVNMDVRKGEVFGVSYTASGTEVQILRFYYAEGEE